MERLDYDVALAKAAKFCSQMERCEQSVRKKMAKWQLADDEIEKIIAYLKEKRYLDEIRFALAYAQDKFRFASWGKSKIVYELRVRDISADVVDMAVQNIDSEVYLERLTSLLTVRLKNIKYKNSYDIKAKLYRFGISKGFESELVLKITENIIKSITHETTIEGFF